MTEALATTETETEIVPVDNKALSTHAGGNLEDFVTFFIDRHDFCINCHSSKHFRHIGET